MSEKGPKGIRIVRSVNPDRSSPVDPKSPEPAAPKEPLPRQPSSSKVDLLTEYLTDVDRVVSEAGALGTDRRADIKNGLRRLDERLRGRVKSDSVDEKLAKYILNAVSPIVRFQEVDQRVLEEGTDNLEQSGKQGIIPSDRSFFVKLEVGRGSHWQKFWIDGNVGLEDSSLVAKAEEVSYLFDEDPNRSLVGQRLRSVWGSSDEAARAWAKETEGLKLLKARIEGLCSFLGEEDPLQKPIDVKTRLKERVERAVGTYVTDYLDYRESQKGEEDLLPRQDTLKRTILDLATVIDRRQEVESRAALHGAFARTVAGAENDIDKLNQTTFPDALNHIGVLTHSKDISGVGEMITLEEIAASNRELAYYNDRLEQARVFLDSIDGDSRFDGMRDELKYWVNVYINGGKLMNYEYDGLVTRIQRIRDKSNIYSRREAEAKAELARLNLTSGQRERALRLGQRIRLVTGSMEEGRWMGAGGQETFKGFRGVMHFAEDIVSEVGKKGKIRVDTYDIIKFTPFAELRARSMWKDNGMRDFWRQVAMQLDPDLDLPEIISIGRGNPDLASINLAGIPQEIFTTNTLSKAYGNWIEGIKSINAGKGEVMGILGKDSYAPASLSDQLPTKIELTKLKFLGDQDLMRAYASFLRELSTPGIFEVLGTAKSRREGANALLKWVDQGALPYSLSDLLIPAGIDRELAQLKDSEILPDQKARLLIHLLYNTEGITYRIGGRDEEDRAMGTGDLLREYLATRTRNTGVSPDLLLRMTLSYAGYSRTESGDLVSDSEARARLTSREIKFFNGFFGKIAIRSYPDIAKLTDEAIWTFVVRSARESWVKGTSRAKRALRKIDLIQREERFRAESAYELMANFLEIKTNLKFGLGGADIRNKVICSEAGDKAMEYLVGDGLRDLPIETEHQRDDPVNPYKDSYAFSDYLFQFVRNSPQWGQRRNRLPMFDMTPEDEWEYFQAMVDFEQIDFVRAARLAPIFGVSQNEAAAYAFKRNWIYGIPNIRIRKPKDKPEESAIGKVAEEGKGLLKSGIIGTLLRFVTPKPRRVFCAVGLGSFIFTSTVASAAGAPWFLLAGNLLLHQTDLPLTPASWVRSLVGRRHLPFSKRELPVQLECHDFKPDPKEVAEGVRDDRKSI